MPRTITIGLILRAGPDASRRGYTVDLARGSPQDGPEAVTRKVFIAAVLLVLAFAGTAHATTYTVTGTGDPAGANCGNPNSCISLRGAIRQIELKPHPPEVINLPAGHFTLAQPPTPSEPS